ncbi:MAG: hypothetical protein K2X74_17890, partial [Acetobacteraceae bacterium]|nr:hypothetical protein [Acetobacteraceae bacterium]
MSDALRLPAAPVAAHPWAAAAAHARDRLSSAFARARHRLALWLPVAFAVGIAAYFALPQEPDPRLPWV